MPSGIFQKLLARLAALLPRDDRRTAKRVTGDAGEEAAARFFREKGYDILVRNWRHGRDELDLVLLAPGSRVLVFVEVKTRDAADPRGGYAAVDSRKRSALKRAVRGYLRSTSRARDTAFRFDIAEVRVENADSLRVIHHCAVPLFTR